MPETAVRRSGTPRYHGAGLRGEPEEAAALCGKKGGTAVKNALSSLKRNRFRDFFFFPEAKKFPIYAGGNNHAEYWHL